jgi:hypothetical protein
MRICRSFEKNISVGQFLFEKHSASYEETFDETETLSNVQEVSDWLYCAAKTDVLNAIEERKKELAETELKKEFKATEEASKKGRGKMSLAEQNLKKVTFREGEEGYKKIDGGYIKNKS